jgi:hypothetical protein
LENKDRAIEHKRLQSVEDVLSELKNILSEPNDKMASRLTKSDFPNIYIVGCARSGSTLFFQLLAKYLDACYPTNFISRFYYAPLIGAKLQYLLNDLDTKKEVLAAFPDFSFTSDLGKTKGPLAPHEFWYFWRNIFDVDDLGYVKNLNTDTITKFHAGLDSIKEVFQKPMVLKGMIANVGLSEIIKNRPRDIVLYIKRDVAFNAQSLLKARQAYFNSLTKWYSFKLPNYQPASNPIQQTVDQVKLTNELIEKELDKIDNPIFTIDYENLEIALPRLLKSLANLGVGYDLHDEWKKDIQIKNKVSIKQEDWDLLNSISK